jgi:AraC family transcriptional regulator
MTKTRRATPQARLARVLAHIHDHLDQPLDLDRLADLAHYSPYHWHRIWHACFGETLAATVRRLRMHRASGLLAHSTIGIRQIARRCGYDHDESFARTFRATYGMTPLAFRRRAAAGALVGTSSDGQWRTGPPASPVADGASAWSVQIREWPAIRIAGLEHRGSYMGIGRAFETAFVALKARGGVDARTRWLAIYLDDPFAVPETALRSRAGLTLPDGVSVPEGLSTYTIGPGRCAVLRYQGPYADMRAAYRWLYGQWLPASGFEPADHPVFEEYLNLPQNTPAAQLLTEIVLPLADSAIGR